MVAFFFELVESADVAVIADAAGAGAGAIGKSACKLKLKKNKPNKLKLNLLNLHIKFSPKFNFISAFFMLIYKGSLAGALAAGGTVAATGAFAIGVASGAVGPAAHNPKNGIVHSELATAAGSVAIRAF